MNLNYLIGPGLGLIPEVGPLLAGIYSGEKSSSFNNKLLSILSNIESVVDEMNKELASIGLDLALHELFEDTHHAQLDIFKWYIAPDSPVRNWLHGDSTGHTWKNGYLCTTGSHTGHEIKTKCRAHLSTINVAVLGEYKVTDPKPWLEWAVRRMIINESPNQTVSNVENSYQFFLSLVHLQIAGLMCLRAINSPILAQQTYLVNSRIIAQGKLCQKIVDKYLDPSNQDYAKFTWFLNNSSSPSPSRHLSIKKQKYLSLDFQNKKVTAAVAGIEIKGPGGKDNSNQWGPSIALGTVNKHGHFISGHWSSFKASPDNYINLTNDYHHVAATYSKTPIELSGSQVITGVSINCEQMEWHVNDPNSKRRTNGLSLKISAAKLSPDGIIRDGQYISQEPPQITRFTEGLKYVALNQLSSIKKHSDKSTPTICNSPITGIGFCQTGNQIGIQLQTSLHAKAFTPLPIHPKQLVAIQSPIAKENLEIQKSTNIGFSSEKESKLGQAFLLTGLNDKLKYGDKIQISSSIPIFQTNSVSVSKGGLAVATGTSEQKKSSTWILVNPANVEGGYGTDPAPNIYNWSSVAFRNEASPDLFLQTIKVAGSSNYSPDLGKPKISPDTTDISTKPAKLISDTSFLWNVCVKPELRMGRYAIHAPVSGSGGHWYLSLGKTANAIKVRESTKQEVLIYRLGENAYRIQSIEPPYYCLQEKGQGYLLAEFKPNDRSFEFSISQFTKKFHGISGNLISIAGYSGMYLNLYVIPGEQPSRVLVQEPILISPIKGTGAISFF